MDYMVEHYGIRKYDSLLVPMSQISTGMRMTMLLFWCTSVSEQNEAFEQIRRIISDIFHAVLRDSQDKIYLNSLYYQLLHVLTSRFLLTKENLSGISGEDERAKQIMA